MNLGVQEEIVVGLWRLTAVDIAGDCDRLQSRRVCSDSDGGDEDD
jgi:hypothetical protein